MSWSVGILGGSRVNSEKGEYEVFIRRNQNAVGDAND